MNERQEAEWLFAKALEIVVLLKGPIRKRLNLKNYLKILAGYEEAAGLIAGRIMMNAKEMTEKKTIEKILR
jgi:hypothetical protein